MVIINAPWLFSAIWTVVSGFLDEKTAAKISVLGSSYQSELLDLVDAENLPISLGGTSDCPSGIKLAKILGCDVGPWNDGTVEGYPQPSWEGFKDRDLGSEETSMSSSTSFPLGSEVSKGQ
jgi:CRAL/TRIO domain